MPAVVSLCLPAMDTILLTTSGAIGGRDRCRLLKKRVARTLLSASRSPEFASSAVGIGSKSGSGACTRARLSEADNRPPQTLVVKLIGGSARRPAGKIRADRNDGVLFLHILMDGVVGKASQSKARAGENRFDLVGGREAANPVEDVGGLFFGQH